MPKLKKQRNHNLDLIRKRWSIESESTKSSGVSTDEEYSGIEENINIDSINFLQDSIIDDITDVFSFCKTHINVRFISVLLYMNLRYFGHSWRAIDAFLNNIGGTTAKTAHKWSNVLMNNDFDEFTYDERGGKRNDAFWDCYPDLELEAKNYVIQECSKKEATFTAASLANFIDHRFYEINDTVKTDDKLIRSIASCKLDLRNFGAKFTKNTSRPYFLGHERADVVKYREQFIKYFIDNKDSFYTTTNDILPRWKIPTGRPIILFCHDESTYKTGETTAKRWIMSDNAPFYDKGKGRSIMCSEFLVMHPSGPFFSLTDDEYSEALMKYPELSIDHDLIYEKNSASASIRVGGDSYFNNQVILDQFERLFKLLPFKNEYKNHCFVFLVDNARTHTKADFSLHDFGMKPGTRCPVDHIEYIDEQSQRRTIECYDKDGKSKGLSRLANELNIVVPKKCSLSQLKSLLSEHAAFKTVSKLEKLAIQYSQLP